MSDASSTPGFNPSDHEHHESYMNAFDAMGLLHAIYERAHKRDEEDEESRNQALLEDSEGGVDLELRPYIQLGFPEGDDSPLDTMYHQVMLRTRPRTVGRSLVRYMIARYPIVEGTASPMSLPENISRWNDVALEVTFKNDQSDADEIQRYWLNSRGLVAYRNHNDLEPNINRMSGDNDLFLVKPHLDELSARPMSGTELLQVLHDSLTLRQSDSAED